MKETKKINEEKNFKSGAPLAAAAERDAIVGDKPFEQLHVGRARLQSAVVLWCDLAHLQQVFRRNRREVVVFVVCSDVPHDFVPDAVIGKGFLLLMVGVEDDVLGEKVACGGVQPAREEERQEEVGDAAGFEGREQPRVEGALDQHVRDREGAERLRLEEERAQRVEEELECEPDKLSELTDEHVALELRGQVEVLRRAQRGVVRQVVLAKHDRKREEEREV